MMNNKRISSIKAVFVAILVCITFMSLPMQGVKATQTRKDNFNKNYSITGNGPADMLSIAFAQVGKTGNDLGYSEAWCANFVSDCADLAGQSQAIPRHGAVSNLRDLVISAGGSYVNSPVPGDLVIWKNSISHVEIVSKVENGVIYSIGGNNGGTGNPKTNRVAGERKVTSIGTVTCYVRPNYSNPKPDIITPTISTDRAAYIVGDTVNISWAASPTNSNLSHYWLNVIAPDGTWIYGGTMNKETSYSFVASQVGDYSVTTYATPIGSLEGEGSLTDSISISVSQSVWYADLSPVDVGSDFYAYIINVDPWLHLKNNNGNVETASPLREQTQFWKFTRNSDGSYKIVNCADGNCLDVYGAYSDSGTNIQTYPAHDDTSAQKWFIYGESGNYVFRPACSACVLDVTNASSSTGANIQIYTKNDSSAQKFQIWKEMAELSVTPGNRATKTAFDWSDFLGDGIHYNLRIWKGTLWEGDSFKDVWKIEDKTDCEVDLPAGHYEAYVDVCIGTEVQMTNVIKFDVTEDYFGQSELKVVAGDKYNKTRFEWTTVENADFYDLKIWNGTVWEGDAYQIEWGIEDTSTELALPAGYYEAYIDARDTNHMQMSNVVKFAVKRDYQVFKGDANDDGEVTIADVVMLQKWLLGIGELTCWQNVDLYEDNRIDVFDMVEMRKLIVKK